MTAVNRTLMVFDANGLTNGERDAVYEAVIDLVSKRLQRAQTITH